MAEKNTFYLRLLLPGTVIATSLILCVIFFFQYKEYKEVEARLNKAYETKTNSSPIIYELMTTFSEVDNLFRLYAVSFDKDNLKAYQDKLDTLNDIITRVDSIQQLKISATNNIIDQNIALQYVQLKKRIDDLITFADEKLANNTTDLNSRRLSRSRMTTDSLMKNIMRDTSYKDVMQDTIVRKKQSLFKRIFNAKDDTTFNQVKKEIFNVNQLNIIEKNVENLVQANERVYNRNFRELQRIYLLSKEQERNLITSNYSLLSDLKKTIDDIKEQEAQLLRESEKSDYFLLQKNSHKFGIYAMMALGIIFLMLIFIVYYQYLVANYESKIIKEKEYAANVAEEKTNLLANISHEIRTPLISLQGVVHLLKNNEFTPEKLDRTLINNIDQDISVINNSINDILSLSKIESGNMEVVMDEVYIAKIIEDTYSLHTFQASNKGLKLNKENNLKHNLKIISNEFRLRQIISNLISNAIKYTEKGSVTIRAYISNNQIFVDVEDTGIGIEKSKQEQIFRKYYIVENKKTGFGLGLHISQLLANQINGKLSVKSQLGKGSTFTLQIPLKLAQGQKNQKKDSMPSSKTDLSKDLSIVLIDDNKINLLLAKQMFKDFEHVSFFEDAANALNFIKQYKTDIVVTDVIMPHMSGWDLLDAIKSSAKLKHILVFANTADEAVAENNHSSSNHAFDGIITKPISVQKLAEAYKKIKE